MPAHLSCPDLNMPSCTFSKDGYSIFTAINQETWPRGYKTFFMLNSAEHKNFNARKYKNIKKSAFLGSNRSRKLVFPLINV